MRSAGVDYHSKNKLKKLYDEGYSVEEAGFMASVLDENVKKWFDHWDQVSPRARAEEPKPAKKKASSKKD